MPKPKPASRAPELQQLLRTLLGHDHIRVKPYGSHLLIQLSSEDGEADTVARFTELGRDTRGAAFRPPSGRWKPLPGPGPLKEMAELAVNLLGPYLQAHSSKKLQGG